MNTINSEIPENEEPFLPTLCSDCVFWKRENFGDVEAECHMDPPKVHVIMVPQQTIQGPAMEARILSLFPRTKFDCYCGAGEPGEFHSPESKPMIEPHH